MSGTSQCLSCHALTKPVDGVCVKCGAVKGFDEKEKAVTKKMEGMKLQIPKDSIVALIARYYNVEGIRFMEELRGEPNCEIAVMFNYVEGIVKKAKRDGL